MSRIKCLYECCNKEFKTPVLVTNFTFTPKKETYNACPFCLSRIENPTKTYKNTSDTSRPTIINEITKLEETSIMQPETITIDQKKIDESILPQDDTLEKIEDLEKKKQDLLAELAELRNGAIKKINNLQQDVNALKAEAEILKQLIK